MSRKIKACDLQRYHRLSSWRNFTKGNKLEQAHQIYVHNVLHLKSLSHHNLSEKIALLTFVVVKNAFVVLYSPRKDAGMKQDRQVRQSVFVPVTNSLCKKK